MQITHRFLVAFFPPSSTIYIASAFCVVRRNTPGGHKGAVVFLPRVSPEG